MLDMQKMVDGIHDYIAKAFAPMIERMKAVEQKLADMPTPKDGTSITVEDVAPLIAEQVSKAVAAIPVPKDGENVDPAEVQRMVAEAIAALPVPKDGENVTAEQVLPELRADLAKAIDAIPKPQDGQSVTIDDVMPVIEQHMAKWELDFERRAQELFQRTLDRMPQAKDGKDGRDGLDLKDFDATLDEDGRTLTLSLVADGAEVKRSITLPVTIDQGVYRPETAYVKGDGVTYGGSFWIAQKDAPSTKPDGGDAWRLAVKRGRDGKDGRDGDKGERGIRGMSNEEVQKRRASGEDV